MASSTADLNRKLNDLSLYNEEGALPLLEEDDVAFLNGEKEKLLEKHLEKNPLAQESKLEAFPQRKITLQHVKQTHMPRFCKPVPIVKEKVSYSQYHVAKTILANPNAIVLDEGLYEDFTPEVAKKLQKDPLNMFDVAKIIFPNGIPDQFDKLEELQKDFFAEIGGCRVLFYLNKLTHIYKTSSEEENKKLESEIAKNDFTMVFEPREKQALFWAKQAAIKSGKNHILLVYGAAHNFEKHKDILSKEGVEIQMSIDTRKPEPKTSSFPMFDKTKFSDHLTKLKSIKSELIKAKPVSGLII